MAKVIIPGDPIQVPTYETTTYDYCGSLVYQNGVLKRILVDGGYISITKTGTGSNATYAPTYHAYLRDHLGSNRVVASVSGTAEEVYHYYPYGGLFATPTTSLQPYLYCSKELDTMHGGNLTSQIGRLLYMHRMVLRTLFSLADAAEKQFHPAKKLKYPKEVRIIK